MLGRFRYKYHHHRPPFRSSHTICSLSLHIAHHSPTARHTLTIVFLLLASHSSFVSSPCGKCSCPAWLVSYGRHTKQRLTTVINSGIFGYINYLVEKDRKYILDTLVNGM